MNPNVLVLRHEKYAHYDVILQQCNFSTIITSEIEQVRLLYNEHYNVMITIGDSWEEYPIEHLLINKCFKKWINLQPGSLQVESINKQVLNCYIANLPKRLEFRPEVSAFTPSYKSREKILRPYRSLLAQKMQNWEWVIIDDSGENDQNWKDLCELKDPRVRVYKRNGNSGYIGNVKNEACGLCRGKYLIELDHDDDILPDCCGDIVKGFEWNSEVGFIYMNFSELYEDWSNFNYGNLFSFGFGNYYRQFVTSPTGQKQWLYSCMSSQINNMTIIDLIGVPNHPRVWRKTVLEQIGGYSESMPIADDYEVLLKTFFATKMLLIPKLSYLQYKNAGGNNFSIIRIGQIRKIQDAVSAFYKKDFDNYFKDLPKTLSGNMWRGEKYVDCKVNLVKNFDHDFTILVKSINGLDQIMELRKTPRVDIILVLSFDFKTEELLENKGLTDIKFYVLEGATDMEIENYFFRCYLTTNKFRVIE